MKLFRQSLFSLSIVLLSHWPAMGMETPIGLPQSMYGMEMAAVYLQAVEMEPSGIMKSRAESDVHLECDIKAGENNPNGFAAGEWIPNLTIHYTLTKLDTNETIEGMMMPMVANDGPHYGDNVKMLGLGKYKLAYKIENPLKKGEFGRHIDRETGVRDWFKPFEVEWEFEFLGAGKRGGY